MKTALICLGLACLIAVSSADANCDNPLLENFGFDEAAGALADPVSGTDLPYCKTLQAGQTCCSKALVSTFQDKAQDVADTLSENVAIRDKAIVKTRDELIPELKSSLTRLQAAMTKIGGGMDLGDFDIEALTTTFDSMAAQYLTAVPALKAAFNGFQSSRTTCVLAMFELQAAAWCLACNPNYADFGITEQNVFPTISDEVQKRITDACFDFVTGAVSQSALLTVTTAASMIDSLATLMEKLSSGGVPDMEALAEIMAGLGGGMGGGEVDPTLIPAYIPEGECSSADDCTWIMENFFEDLEINTEALLLGGGTPPLQGLPVLNRVLKKAKRNLDDPEWNPSEDESGVEVEFKDDPAGVKTEETPAASAGIAKVGVAVLAMLAVFLF